MQISFTVQGRPPRKSKWGKESDISEITSLRRAALEALNRTGTSWNIHSTVRLELIVYAPNTTDADYRQSGDDDPAKVIGDLDSLISGVCDYLQPAPKNRDMEIDPTLEKDPNIGPTIPVVIADDMQIVEIDAKKIEAKSPYYTVSIISVPPQ